MSEGVELGFCPRQTRDNLLAWLRENGVESSADSSAQSLPEQEREAVLWKEAESAAIVHMTLHAVPCKIRVDRNEWQDSERCDKKPCKLSGISCALFELCRDWRARDQADFSIGIDAIAMAIGALNPAVVTMLERAASNELRQMDDARRDQLALAAENEAVGRLDVEALVRQGIEQTDALLERRRRHLEGGRRLAEACRYAAALAAELISGEGVHGTPHRPLPSERAAGRPEASLLNATLQHLKNGGLEYHAIRELVAGMGGGATSSGGDAVKDQIRRKIRGRDRRTIRPFEE